MNASRGAVLLVLAVLALSVNAAKHKYKDKEQIILWANKGENQGGVTSSMQSAVHCNGFPAMTRMWQLIGTAPPVLGA
jgi:hypothetical protein